MNAGPALTRLLGLPSRFKVLLLLPVGRPAADATVPSISRKPLNEIMSIH